MKVFKKSLLMLLILPFAQLSLAEMPAANNGQYQKSYYEYKPWQSGKGIAARYTTAPLSHNLQRGYASPNPWKKKASVYAGAKSNQQRPWGNAPQSRAKPKMGMQYFDEKFKHSSHQSDATYAGELTSSNYSGMGGMNHRYGMYPYGVYPPNRYYRNNTGLFGFMNNFIPW